MPKRREFEFEATHMLADGRVLTDQEFSVFVIDEKKNQDLLNDIAERLDPVFAAKQRAIRRAKAVKERREKLEQDRRRIELELGTL